MKEAIVLISPIFWGSTWQVYQRVSVGLVKLGYKVIFIEPFPRRWFSLKKASRIVHRLVGLFQHSVSDLSSLNQGVLVITPFSLPDSFSLFCWLNDNIFIPITLRKIRSLTKSQDIVIFNSLPSQTSLLMQIKMKPTLIIYGCFLDWQNSPHASSSIKNIESQLIQSADLIIADSDYLVEKCSRMHNHVVQMQYGVDDHFFTNSILGKSQEPKIAYFGSVGVNINIRLLEMVSHQYKLKVIGPVHVDIKGFSKTTEFFGLIHPNKIPALMKDVDVIVLPYDQRSKHTQGTFPAKTFECLALGIPTVAIGLPSLEKYSAYFYLCENEEDFFYSIEKAFHEDSPSQRAQRITFAHENSWDKRVETLNELIIDFKIRKMDSKRCKDVEKF